MTKHILYSLTAIICTSLVCITYALINRYESVSRPYQRDNWNGTVGLPNPKNPAKPRFPGNPYDSTNP